MRFSNLILPLILLVTMVPAAKGQRLEYVINSAEAERIGKILASDEMAGRRVFTPGIEMAADMIESEFRKIGLRTLDANDQYRQTFRMVRSTLLSASCSLNGKELAADRLVVLTSQPELHLDASSAYEVERISAGGSLFRQAARFMNPRKNTLVLVDEKFASDFPRLNNFKRSMMRSEKNLLFLLSNEAPEDFQVTARHEITEQGLFNVVGVLPGRSRKDEIVVFSAHYDHLGTGAPADGDSIYNGANDNASGTTALILLARYFREMKNNERTLVFAAFTGEEAGGLGSQYFARQVDPDKIVAMINIEMIGTESKWGRNSAYITGFDKSDMGAILQRNLEGTGFTFYPDPYPAQQLFYRSDNATLARLGVPAHTISTSKMDTEPNYHKPGDEHHTLDMDNMAAIIRAIAISSKGIVEGKDRPGRILD